SKSLSPMNRAHENYRGHNPASAGSSTRGAENFALTESDLQNVVEQSTARDCRELDVLRTPRTKIDLI
ncbi:hypothetical protein, partial [Burkholderia ambifaria]|uniref:hypothetical protein n=1 Tax=Burkholderia ambifaria TaxID=152480 RepID=UPI001ABBD2ED